MIRTGGLCQRVCSVFSSDQFAQMKSKSSTSNHTALGYAECVPTFGRAFWHQELPVVSLYKGTTASTARRHTGWKTDVTSFC